MAQIDPTLLEPKEVKIGGKDFLLSKLPATVARETLIAYFKAMQDAVGADGQTDMKRVDFDAIKKDKVLKLLSYASVKIGDSWMRLSTEQVIDSHVSDLAMYIQLEMEMVGHSMGFSATAQNSPS